MNTELILPFPVGYELELAPSSKNALLVLHGFSDHGQAAKKRLLGWEPKASHTILAPNGLFPVPVKKADGYRKAYAWYFRDPDTGLELVSPEFAADVIMRLINKLGMLDLDWKILGFSQGGFLAPYLVRAGLNAKNIISVGAAYRPDAYAGLPAVKLSAIHGEADDIVSFATAQSSFEKIKEMGYGKEFYPIPKLAHTLNDEGRALLWKLVLETNEA